MRMEAAEPHEEPNVSALRKDIWLITLSRGLRSFAYGVLAVLFGLTLLAEGLSATQIGALLAVSLVGDFLGTYLIGASADRWGRRRTLAWLAALMAVAGAVFCLTSAYPALLVVALVGTLGTTASETAPFLPIEQAMLSQISAPEQRAMVFARYNLVATFALALGSLSAGTPALLTRLGLAPLAADRLVLAVYALLAVIVVALVSRLSPLVEAATVAPAIVQPGRIALPRLLPALGGSQKIILRLSALFSVDAFAGGLVAQSLMALYFHLRFGAPLAPLAALFFGANLLAALSALVAARLARRFGLLNTMVFTHLPSNILLALVAFAPTFPIAAGLLLARQALSQMDVPTRQVYTMALVAPEERTASASVTSLARSAGSSVSPALTGALLQPMFLLLGLPFLLSGGLKIAYDLALWAIFRRVRLDETRK